MAEVDERGRDASCAGLFAPHSRAHVVKCATFRGFHGQFRGRSASSTESAVDAPGRRHRCADDASPTGAKPDPPKKKHPIEYLQALTPLIIAAVGWFVTDAVRSGFERQRLQLSNVTEMRDLLVKLVGPSVTCRMRRRPHRR
jgi:hypothetical protein